MRDQYIEFVADRIDAKGRLQVPRMVRDMAEKNGYKLTDTKFKIKLYLI